MTIRSRQHNFHPAAIFDSPVAYAFWMLLIFILINPRGLFPHGDKNGLIVIAIQCVCCAIVICLARVHLVQALGLPGILIVGAFLSYLLIGFAALIIFGAEVKVDTDRVFRNNIFFLPALLAMACGIRTMLVRIGIDIFLKYLLVIMIVSCTIVILTPILRDFGLLPLTPYSYQNSGLHPTPNEVGLIGCATVVLALSLSCYSRSRALEYLGLTAGFLTVLASLSKTGMLMLITILFFFLIFNGQGRRGTIISWIGVAVVLLIFVTALSPDLKNMVENISDNHRVIYIYLLFTEARIDEALLSGRGLLWSLGLQLALEAPIYGNGIGRLRVMEGAPIHWFSAQPSGVHNMYLLLIGEAGFLPLSLYLMHMFSLIRLWWIVPKSAARDTIVGWTIMIGLFGFSSHHLFDLWVYAFLCGLSCAIATAVMETHHRKSIPP